MTPATSAVNLTPTLTAPVSASLALTGAASGEKIVQGQTCVPTVTGTPADGVSRLPLSSTARDLMTGVEAATGVHA